MTDTLALEGLGAKIRFNASGFESDLIALTLSPKARATIDTTHLGTEAAKTKRPGQTQDLGTIEAVFDHDPAAVSLVGRPAEQVIITYPEDLGYEFDPIVLWAFATEQGGERMFPDGRMVTAVTLSLSVPDAVAVENSPEAPALADPAKWIGAWDLNTAAMINIISGKPGGPIATAGTFLWGASVGIDGTGGAGKPIPDYNGNLATVGGTPIDPVGSFTVSFFARLEVVVSSYGLNVRLFQSVEFLTLVSAGTQYFNFHIASAVYFNWALFDGAWHVYVFQYNADTGQYRFIIDGDIVSAGFSAPGMSTGVADFVRFQAIDGGSNDPIHLDNITVTREYLSDEAIATLVAGEMPDASGNLL